MARIYVLIWGQNNDGFVCDWDVVPRVGETIVTSNPTRNLKVVEVVYDLREDGMTVRVNTEPQKSN